MDENIEPQNIQPPESIDPNTVVPDGTPTYVDPAPDSRAAEVGEKTGAQENWINPNEVNTMGTNAVKMGGKAWVWWTVAGVITTLVILLGGTYYFYKVRGNESMNVATVSALLSDSEKSDMINEARKYIKDKNVQWEKRYENNTVLKQPSISVVDLVTQNNPVVASISKGCFSVDWKVKTEKNGKMGSYNVSVIFNKEKKIQSNVYAVGYEAVVDMTPTKTQSSCTNRGDGAGDSDWQALFKNNTNENYNTSFFPQCRLDKTLSRGQFMFYADDAPPKMKYFGIFNTDDITAFLITTDTVIKINRASSTRDYLASIFTGQLKLTSDNKDATVHLVGEKGRATLIELNNFKI